MSLINYKVNIILTWSGKSAKSEVNNVTTFAIAGTKRYVAIVTSWTNTNSKLLQQLEISFKSTTKRKNTKK